MRTRTNCCPRRRDHAPRSRVLLVKPPMSSAVCGVVRRERLSRAVSAVVTTGLHSGCMPRAAVHSSHALEPSQARRLWLRAQRLDNRAPFGDGPAATRAAVEHLGYVHIDTIHVIERCQHHNLYPRIPTYEREHLRRAQSVDKTVFEYWSHALAY